MSFELLLWSLSNLILRMNSCVDISCSCCKFSVQPVTSLLCFFVVISLILCSICTLRVQHELPRVFVPASFPSCRNVWMVLWCDHVKSNTNMFIPPYFGLWVSIIVGCSGTWPIWFCDHVSLPSWVHCELEINPLPLSWSVSSSMKRPLLHYKIRDWQDIESIFVHLAILLCRSQACTASTIFNACFSI